MPDFQRAALSTDWQDDPLYLPSLKSPIDQVEEGLYIGNVIGRHEIVERKIPVDLIISIVGHADRASLQPTLAVESGHDLDDTDKTDPRIVHLMLDTTTRLITEARAAGQTVFVHCGAGVSRSATVVLDYLMQRDGFTFAAALTRLEKARYCVCPNRLFQRVLKEREGRK
jgi:dual specificity MAP kinase phosphatase